MTTLYEIDITRANDLIGQWGRIAASIAQQCKWRPQGKCLATCQGLDVCNLDCLTLVDTHGQPVGATTVGQASPPAVLKPEA